MGQDSVAVAVPRYRAFISYSHADARFAGWLHRKLEGWRLPDGSKLAPLFIDRAELAAGPDLSIQVREALEQSAALVVVTSPNARSSRWVGQEIALFRQLQPDRPVLAALIEGEPDDAFPAELLEHRGARVEPLAADFRDGQDGRRLGLIKIVAGLSGLPLDRLVQRDAQTRQRRVMAITAGALVLSLVLAALLVFALRARAEAERQRAEAEGLVEFMLTDLRDKLKGVGRLDVMDAVNERAMAHYAGETNIESLPLDVLLRRAKLLQAMAEDDFSNSGKPDERSSFRARGLKTAERAWLLTNTLLAQNSDNPEVIFVHSQSEYYLGYGIYIGRADPAQPLLPSARRHFERYRFLAAKLVSIQPDNLRWQRELSYADGNLCAIGLERNSDPKGTLASCHAAREVMESVFRAKPDELESFLDLANRLAWEADAQKATGRPDRALDLRRRQIELAERSRQKFPKDTRAIEAELLSRIGLSKIYLALGRQAEAQGELARARQANEELRALDPRNRNWQIWSNQITGNEN